MCRCSANSRSETSSPPRPPRRSQETHTLNSTHTTCKSPQHKNSEGGRALQWTVHTHYCETNWQQLSFRVSESSSVGHQTKQSMSDTNRRLSAVQGERKRHILLPITTVSSPRQPCRALSQGPVKGRTHTHVRVRTWTLTPDSEGRHNCKAIAKPLQTTRAEGSAAEVNGRVTAPPPPHTPPRAQAPPK